MAVGAALAAERMYSICPNIEIFSLHIHLEYLVYTDEPYIYNMKRIFLRSSRPISAGFCRRQCCYDVGQDANELRRNFSGA